MRTGNLPMEHPRVARTLIHLRLAYEGLGLLNFHALPQYWTEAAVVFLEAVDKIRAEKAKTKDGHSQEIPIGPNRTRSMRRDNLI